MNARALVFTSIAFSLAVLSPKARAQSASTHGAIPSSNQAQFDDATSSVYLGVQQTGLLPAAWEASHFSIGLEQQRKNYFDLDLLTNVYRGTNTSLWVDYGVGFLTAKGSVFDLKNNAALDAEVAGLVVLPLRLGLQLHLDVWHALVPFVGIQGTEYLYRLSSSMSGAEDQGDFSTFGAVAGVELNAKAVTNASLIVELIQQTFLKPLAGGSTGIDFLAGLGWSF